MSYSESTLVSFYRNLINFKLSFSVPPQKIVVIDEFGSPLTSVVGPFPEGASFTLRCDVFGGKEFY